MVRCRSQKCLERQKEIVRKIMLTIPEKYRLDYEEVKRLAKPFIQKTEWLNWVYEEKK